MYKTHNFYLEVTQYIEKLPHLKENVNVPRTRKN